MSTVTDSNHDHELKILMARTLASTDWHKLSPEQQKVVKILEDSCYLNKKDVPDGFVGSATRWPSRIRASSLEAVPAESKVFVVQLYNRNSYHIAFAVMTKPGKQDEVKSLLENFSFRGSKKEIIEKLSESLSDEIAEITDTESILGSMRG